MPPAVPVRVVCDLRAHARHDAATLTEDARPDALNASCGLALPACAGVGLLLAAVNATPGPAGQVIY
jgi:hypothetical protein